MRSLRRKTHQRRRSASGGEIGFGEETTKFRRFTARNPKLFERKRSPCSGTRFDVVGWAKSSPERREQKTGVAADAREEGKNGADSAPVTKGDGGKSKGEGGGASASIYRQERDAAGHGRWHSMGAGAHECDSGGGVVGLSQAALAREGAGAGVRRGGNEPIRLVLVRVNSKLEQEEAWLGS